MVSNNVVVLRDKSGGLIASMSVNDFFRPGRPARVDTGGDPWMIFDTFSQRYFYVMDGSAGNGHLVQCEPGECEAYHLLAVSKSADPRGLSQSDWHFYALDRTLLRTPNGTIQTATWGDYDNVAVDEQSVVISWPAYGFGVGSGEAGHSQGPKVRIIDKAPMLNGGPVTGWTDLEVTTPGGGSPFEKAEVAVGSGGAAPFFLVGTRGCDIGLWAIESARSSPRLSAQVLRPSGLCHPTGGLVGATQPDGVAPIDVLAAGHNVTYRDGSVWFAHLVRVSSSSTETATRWFQIDVSAWPARARFVQDATFVEQGAFHLSPALTLDASGNAVMVYGRSSATEYPSVYFTFRKATDPEGQMRPGQRLKAGSSTWAAFSSVTGSRNRWVDFFAATPDPVDGTVWVFGAYTTSEGERGTWVANIVVAP